jgi:SAM-dependent methyltransferase
MPNYARMYRFGITPWERYGAVAAASITALLDREETERSRPLGRALDLGCGRGQYTPELARRGWEVGWPMNKTAPRWYRLRRHT